MINITVKDLENLYFDSALAVDNKELRVVEETEWVHGHKAQYKEIFFTDGEKYYTGTIGRTGDDFSYWTYDSEIMGEDTSADIVEVKKVEVTTYKWVPVE